MSDGVYEQKTFVWKLPMGGTTSGTGIVDLPSMRDRFAMAALTSMLSAPQERREDRFQFVADLSYKFADAMLEARKDK